MKFSTICCTILATLFSGCSAIVTPSKTVELGVFTNTDSGDLVLNVSLPWRNVFWRIRLRESDPQTSNSLPVAVSIKNIGKSEITAKRGEVQTTISPGNQFTLYTGPLGVLLDGRQQLKIHDYNRLPYNIQISIQATSPGSILPSNIQATAHANDSM